MRSAEDETTAELSIHLGLHGGRLFVRGDVASDERRRAVLDLVHEHCGDVPIVDELTVAAEGLAHAARPPGGDLMIRVAAVGDVHLAPDIAGRHRAGLATLADEADVLLLAGDLTRHGTVDEAEVVAAEYADLGVPVIAVLGNHDYHSDQQAEITDLLTRAGITVLEGTSVVLETPGGDAGRRRGQGLRPRVRRTLRQRLRRAGDEGVRPSRPRQRRAARGRAGRAAADRRPRRALRTSRRSTGRWSASRRRSGRSSATTCWARRSTPPAATSRSTATPTPGTEKGVTDGGVRVRNVAQPVIGAAYALYDVASHPASVAV